MPANKIMAPAEKLIMPALIFNMSPQHIKIGTMLWRIVAVNIAIVAVLPPVKMAKITKMPTGMINENAIFNNVPFMLCLFI
jgi:hypothetical protein